MVLESMDLPITEQDIPARFRNFLFQTCLLKNVFSYKQLSPGLFAQTAYLIVWSNSGLNMEEQSLVFPKNCLANALHGHILLNFAQQMCQRSQDFCVTWPMLWPLWLECANNAGLADQSLPQPPPLKQRHYVTALPVLHCYPESNWLLLPPLVHYPPSQVFTLNSTKWGKLYKNGIMSLQR